MGLITRSEAAYRLKIACSHLNNAACACRDGSWKGALEQAREALAKLDAIMPHLEEVADTDDTCAFFAAQPTERVGGLGYRGSSRKTKTKPPSVVPKPIVTPPPIKPIVTPPPPPKRIVAKSPEVGDLVQWENGGALCLPEPRRLNWISDDGEWAIIEGSNTGLPLRELFVVV